LSALPSTQERASVDLRARLARLGRDTPLVQVLVLLAIFAYGAATLDGFSSLVSVKSMLLLSAFLGLAALGQTVLVLLGHLDLSVPGFIGLGNVLTAILVGEHHWSFVAAAAVIVLASAGAYFEFDQNDDVIIASGNEFAIADSAIQDEVAP